MRIIKSNLWDLSKTKLKSNVKIPAKMANSELGLNDITADPLFLILYHAQPLDVLRVCQINKRFQAMCQNPILFRALIRVHYPESFEDDTPKEQYKALMGRFETTYKIPYVEYPRFIGNPVQHGITQWPHRTHGFRVIAESRADREILVGPGYIPESLRYLVTDKEKEGYIYYGAYHVTADSEEIDELFRAGKLSESIIRAGKRYEFKALEDVRMLSVPGYPILPGTKAWLLLPKDDYDIPECRSMIFKSKEELAKYLVEWKYDKTLRLKCQLFLESRQHGFDFTYGSSTEEDFQELINCPRFRANIKLDDGRLFTEENLYNYILEHDEVWLALDEQLTSSEIIVDNTWLFKEITF